MPSRCLGGNPEEEQESLLGEQYDGPEREQSASTYTYEDAIKATGFGKFSLYLLFLCGWAVSSDAIEVLSVTFMLPSGSCDLHLTSADKGWLNSVIFLGMMVGGYVWGSMADRVGRRSVLLGSLTVNGLFGLASSTAQVFWLFLLLRFFSGVGVGGSIPVIFSYFTEFQHKSKRGMMISVLATFWMFGNIVAAGLAWIVIPYQDLDYRSPNFVYNSWRIFLALCTIPSLTSAAIFVLMPESPKFLLHMGKEGEAVQILKNVHKMNKSKTSFQIKSVILDSEAGDTGPFEASTRNYSTGRCHNFVLGLKHMWSQSVELFQKPLRRTTIVILIAHVTLSFGYFGLWMWFPELFSRVEKFGGSPCERVTLLPNVSMATNATDPCHVDNWVYFEGFMTALSNLPGNLLTIFLMDRLGRRLLLSSSMVASGVCVFFIPFIKSKVENLIISCLFGAISTIGWNSLDVLEAELFPTGVRSTAMGLLTGLSRVSAILGNQAFGQLVDVHCAVPLILVASLLAFGGLISIKLPNTTRKDIH
ncbi:hypothetical protein ScPMuIL_011793 [Solemya velum]